MTGIFGPNKVGEYTESYQSGDHAHYGKIIPGEKLTDDNNNCSCKCDEKLTKEAGHSVYVLSCHLELIYQIDIATKESPAWHNTPPKVAKMKKIDRLKEDVRSIF